MIEITEQRQTSYIETAKGLKGSERRMFMAGVVQGLGRGGQRYAEKTFGWNRRTVRKGMKELTSGRSQVDQFAARGRKRAEERLPHLLDDLRELVDDLNSVDVSVGAEPLNRRWSAVEVRRQLIEQKGYSDDALPCAATIRTKLNELGYRWLSPPKSDRRKNV